MTITGTNDGPVSSALTNQSGVDAQTDVRADIVSPVTARVVATAAVTAGLRVTVVDVDPPLQRLLGEHLSSALCQRAASLGIELRRSGAVLLGDPVRTVRLDDGEELAAKMRQHGLKDVWFKPLTFGIATLYVGRK